MIQSIPLPSQDLREKVGEFAPWTARGEWQVLFGGRTNSAWKVSLENDHLVLKLYRAAGSNPLFPNDAKAEALMLRHLKGLGIAPDLLASFDSAEGYCILYRAIPGAPWRSGISAVAGMMKRLHAQNIPTGLRRIPNGSDEILAHADAILEQCSKPLEVQALRPKLAVPASSKTVLLHCDMVPGNLISQDGDLHLIDWQCPGVGDACEDIAIFLSPAMQTLYRGSPLSKSETEAFLSNYAEMAERYRALAPAYHYRMAAYCVWQIENGFPDYSAGLEVEITAIREQD